MQLLTDEIIDGNDLAALSKTVKFRTGPDETSVSDAEGIVA